MQKLKIFVKNGSEVRDRPSFFVARYRKLRNMKNWHGQIGCNSYSFSSISVWKKGNNSKISNSSKSKNIFY